MANYKKDFDSANIKEYIIENIAKKYIPLRNQSNYRVGIFGHINEMMADAIEDTAVSVKTMYPELFPNKAQLPESIYAYAALAKYDNFNAKPATGKFYLVIYEDELIQALDRTGEVPRYTIPDDTVFYVDNIPFMLDYPIVLTLFNESAGADRIFNATYDTRIPNNLSDIQSPYIKLLRMDYGETVEKEDKVLLLEVVLRQVEKATTTKSIMTNDYIDNTSIRFEYEGDLANFDVWYADEGSSEYEYIEKYLEDSAVITTNKYCYYKFITESMIEIIFPYGNTFRPKLGSSVRVEFYTTLGAGGNKNKYEGLNLRTTYGNSDINPSGRILTLTVFPISDTENGVDKVSMDIAATKIAEEFSARGSINNERDLENYFNDLQDQNYITFFKTRDDCLYRRFAAFMLMRDDSNGIIGTNTLNLRFKESELTKNHSGDIYTVNTKTALQYLSPNDPVSPPPYLGIRKRDLVVTKDISEMSKEEVIDFENKNFLYGIPLLLSINKKPLSAAFYINHINRTSQMDYSYVNDRSSLQMMVNDFTLTRNTFDAYNKYKLSLTINPTIFGRQLGICNVDSNTGEITDLERIKVFAVYKTEDETILGWSPMKLVSYIEDGEKYLFTTELETDDQINLNNMINITKGVFKPGTTEPNNVYLPVNTMNLSLYIVDKETPLSDITLDGVIPNLEGYHISNMYSNVKGIPVELMINLNDIMRSSVAVEQVQGENYFYVKSVPLFRYSYISDIQKLEYILENIELKRLYLNQAVANLPNSFNIDFKIYNTYGKASYYKVGYEGKILDKINISINLRIKLNTGTSENIVDQIKTYIINTIETMNKGYGLNFYVSTLISNLKSQFPEILWVEFMNINGYPTTIQIIEATPQSDITDLYFVPEYINISTTVDKLGDYTPSINLLLV